MRQHRVSSRGQTDSDYQTAYLCSGCTFSFDEETIYFENMHKYILRFILLFFYLITFFKKIIISIRIHQFSHENILNLFVLFLLYIISNVFFFKVYTFLKCKHKDGAVGVERFEYGQFGVA